MESVGTHNINTILGFYNTFSPNWSIVVDAYDWCHEHPSKGKFYASVFNDIIWCFEYEEDALLFALRWSR